MWNPLKHSEFYAYTSPISFQLRGEKRKPKAEPKHIRLNSTAHTEKAQAGNLKKILISIICTIFA